MRASLVGLTAFALVSGVALAEDVSDFGKSPVGQAIQQDESGGGRNIPNFKFDRKHTAGGHYQITDTDWRTYAPRVGIDLGKCPNAMSCDEQPQGQVAGLMYAERGVMPWTCCNKVLARKLGADDTLTPKAVPKPALVAVAPHNWSVFADDDEAQPSFLILGSNHE